MLISDILYEQDQEVTQAQLDALEKVLDRVFAQVGIDVEFTRHFLDRVNDERNRRQITIKELGLLFKKEFIKHGKPIARMGPDAEAVMKDMETDINLPFALRWDANNNELDLIAKTVMRKPDFRTSNKTFTVEGYKLQLERGADMDVLHITDTATGQRTEVRGKPNYETNYDADDKLHQLLDRIGKASNISDLINGEVVGINPRHPDGARAKKATDVAYNESKSADLYHSTHDDESFASILKSGAIKPNFDHEHTTEKDPRPYISLSRDKKFDMFGSLPITLVIDQTKLANSHKITPYDSFAGDDDFDKRSSGSSEAEERVYKPIPISYIKYVILRNANWIDSEAVLAAAKAANIPVVDLNGKPITENFADGKKKGKSRPGRVKRAGASCKGSVTDLRAKAKKYSGERGKMYHWCANMKAGKKK